jgi:outer membrane protein TolC
MLLGQLDLQKERARNCFRITGRRPSPRSDVERALVAVVQTSRQAALQRQAVAESRRALQLSEERMRAGTIDLTTVLQTQQPLFQLDDTLAQVGVARLQALISLLPSARRGLAMALEKRSAQAARLLGQ